MWVATHGKVEGDLLELVLVVGVEAGLFVCNKLVCQCRRRDLRDEQGKQPKSKGCQLHSCGVVMVCGRSCRVAAFAPRLATLELSMLDSSDSGR